MVEISLERLVSLSQTRPVWPEKFAGLLATVEENPEETTSWVVLADWLQEHDEKGLERAARWCGRRQGAGARNTRAMYSHGDPYWAFDLPTTAVAAVLPQTADRRTLAGLLVDLAAALRVLDEDVR